jgi:perosamine synthetase
MIRLAEPQIGADEEAAVLHVLRSGQLTQGPEVEAFEEEFAGSLGAGLHAIAVNSGTSALHLVMAAMGFGPGDEVIVPSFTFAATANAVAFTGATPVFVDIDPTTFNIDPGAVEAAITPRTVAVMPVHLYGLPANLDLLSGICVRHSVALIEDAAQAHMATWSDRAAGTWGAAGTFSFYPTKNMTAAEGGMVLTPDESLARGIRLLRNQGQEVRYFNEVVGLNNRMSELHAAIGRVQLRKLPSWTLLRQSNAATLSLRLNGVIVPKVPTEASHVYHQFTVRVPDGQRDNFVEHMTSCGVSTSVYYPTPVHKLPSFNLALSLPHTETATHEVVSLPVHPGLTESDLDTIVEAANAFHARR